MTLVDASLGSYFKTGTPCVKYKGEIYYQDPYNKGSASDWRCGMGTNKEHTLLSHFENDYEIMINIKSFEIVDELP